MRLSSLFAALALFLLAGTIATFGAIRAADFIESRSVHDVSIALETAEHDWATVHANGLQVELVGTAPNEATRFRALTVANEIVDAERVIDHMNVADAAAIIPPTFTIEILRNNDGVSLIGLIPTASDRDEIVSSIKKIGNGTRITDMLDSADHATPDGWEDALQFGMQALRKLPKSKISIIAGQVSVTAISGSHEEKAAIEARLRRSVPTGINLVLNISAPRPVITPFTLRFLIEDGGARFDACSADTPKSRAQIMIAAKAAGLASSSTCTIGLGVPTPKWGTAVTTGIAALDEMGSGTITFSDADVSLVIPSSVPQATFDRISGELEADLPRVFSLHAVLLEPEKTDGTTGEILIPEFVATRSPEGSVQLRGRVTDERTRSATNSYAQARFGSESVYNATRLDENLPAGWPVRILAGIEVLAELSHGSVLVQANVIEVRGITGNPEANSNIARLLSEKLGASENYKIDVTYEKKLDPQADLATPQECAKQITDILTLRKISFAPGSSDIASDGLRVIEQIAEVMRTCATVRMEIAGHTDSQGREEMNQNLSQARAQSVLNALMARRILTSGLSAKGYGESTPIADNDSEEGREANRRIEFTLIVPKQTEPTLTGLEQQEQSLPETSETPDEQN